ncbi:MAG TPA: metal-dependent transcriptional regulator [Solirubrobacter sp.]|nr:metal-dependent transcriptional regulator [Solirubrobacter sp.]
MSKPHGHSVDDYLEAIHLLVSPIGVYEPARPPAVIAARVADALGVSRTAVGEMLKRLAAEGLLEKGGGRELVLTPAGTARAERVIRRNRIVERFLVDFLGYDAAEAHDHANRIGGAFTDDMVERLHAKLGYPERCPHGWPVAPAQEREESRELVSLADLAKGDAGEIVRQAEQDGGLLSWFEAEGLTPGAKVEVRDIQPAAGHFKIEIGGDEQFIADRAARGLFVRRAPRTK